MTTVTGFPNTSQTAFARISKAPLPGSMWEEEFWNAAPLNGLLARVTEVAFVKTLTISANNPGDEVGISVNGGEILATSGVDNTATALALSTAIMAAGFAWQVYIDDSVPVAAVVTITGVLGQDPTITGVQKGTTAIAIGITTAAVVQPIVAFGEGVVVYDATGGINDNKFRRPSSLTDKFMGVVLRTSGAKLPSGQLGEYDPDLSVDNCTPGFAYSVERRNVGVVVEYIGTAPTVLDDVYLVMSGASAGKWSATDGSVAGTSEVVTLTLTTTAADLVEFDYDGLPPLSIASASGVEVTDAANLYAQWLGSAAYAAIGSIVDNLDGTLTITFVDDTTHAFTDGSGGTSSIAEVVDIAAVAATPATAALREDYSWGKPSIEASADVPARAFLRLSRA